MAAEQTPSATSLTPAQEKALAQLQDGAEHVINKSTGDALVARGLAKRRTALSANAAGYVCWYRKAAR